MKERIFENGIQHSLHGDYYLPDFKLEPETRPIGRWGLMHRDYLKEYRPIVLNQLVLSGKLWTYLADINEQAQQRMETLVKQMMARDSVTEESKGSDQMRWLYDTNFIQSCAYEHVLNELIYM